MLQQHQINEIVEQIVFAYQPEKIYLFGSYATGNVTDDSDLDLFIIKDTNKRKIERNREVRRCIKNYPVTGLDIIVYTPTELNDSLMQTVNIGKEAVTGGILMYERV
jgi:predicted nucleotidyltransferase